MAVPVLNCRYKNVNSFCNEIYPIVLNEYVKRKSEGKHYTLPSVCMAQAGLESGWNLKASTLFGIKGEGVVLDTTEYINGELIKVSASFKSYPTIAAAVQGYYDLMNGSNYNDATYPTATTYEAQINGLTNAVNGNKDADGNVVGYNYATDPDYAKKLLRIINSYGLAIFDEYAESISTEGSESKSENDNIKAGAKVYLTSAPTYVSSTATVANKTRTGYFYLWSAEVLNGRIRLTNLASRVGKSGQVTCWVDVASLTFK